jgi:hypothetical protein
MNMDSEQRLNLPDSVGSSSNPDGGHNNEDDEELGKNQPAANGNTSAPTACMTVHKGSVNLGTPGVCPESNLPDRTIRSASISSMISEGESCMFDTSSNTAGIITGEQEYETQFLGFAPKSFCDGCEYYDM